MLTMTRPAHHQEPGVGELPLQPKPCNHFPAQVRDALVNASQTPIYPDPLARQKAIDRALAKARAAFPELFIKEF